LKQFILQVFNLFFFLKKNVDLKKGLTASNELAKTNGPYETYEGSPISKGILQFDMWGVVPTDRWDWKILRDEIKKFGVRNSLLIAAMPTASTSQILGNNEAFGKFKSFFLCCLK